MVNQNRWWGLRTVCFRNQAGYLSFIPEPKRATLIAQRISDPAAHQPVSRGEMLDATIGRIQTVQAATSAEVQPAPVVLGYAIHLIARKPLSHRVRNETRMRRFRSVNAHHPTLSTGNPK